MNILKQNQTQEALQETICKIHNLELIAVDLDLSDKSQIQFFCGKCLVEKINNNKVTTIEQSKEKILQMKSQYNYLIYIVEKVINSFSNWVQKEMKTKENQARLNYYKNILDQIMDFKQSINNSLDKMYKQIQLYIFPIQKEKQELQIYVQQLNYFDDLMQLSELYSQEQQKSLKLEEDNNFIDEMQKQFELLFNCSEYFQTLDTFKNTKETIKDIMEYNIIELIPLQTIKNESKTPSLSRICNIHKKEIIMIDMESQQIKKIEDRFACVDCICENQQHKYQTIENVNKQWKEYKQESEKILKEYKMESKAKKSDLITQLAQMRKNYNKKLNEISDKLISEQFLCIDKQKQQQNQIKKISIQTLDDESLQKDLKQLIEKEKVPQNQTIINLKNKDSIFQKEIEFHLESLKQYDQQDIQQSLNILKGISIEKNLILQLSEMIQQIQKSGQKEEKHKSQNNFINEIYEFVDQAKKCQLQLNIFNSTIENYQQHVQTISSILQNIELQSKNDKSDKLEQGISQYLNLFNILNEYSNIFDNNNQQLKKFCNIKQIENDQIKLTETNRNLEIEKNNQINSLQKSFDQQLIQKNEKLEQKQRECQDVKLQFDQATQENINLKNQYEQDKKLIIQKSGDEQNKLQQDQDYNKNISQKDSDLKEALRKLDQINKDQLEQEKIKKMQGEKIQQYNKALTFSNTYKHNNCKVSEGGKFVTEVGIGRYCFCVCEQAIPKTGKIQYSFQILNGSEFFVGIGFKDIMQNNSYQSCYNAGYGTYLISEDGMTWSHHNKDIHGKELSFKFKNNDIIMIEVSIEDKYIKWSRQDNPQLTFVLRIETLQELYPCVGLQKQCSIKILDCAGD